MGRGRGRLAVGIGLGAGLGGAAHRPPIASPAASGGRAGRMSVRDEGLGPTLHVHQPMRPCQGTQRCGGALVVGRW